MDGATLLTAGGAVIAIVGSNIALIGWLRSDMKSFETEIRSWKDEIQKEMKDFHVRLCKIDERTKRQDFESRKRKNNRQT